MNLIKTAQRVAKFLSGQADNPGSVYVHLRSDVFLKEIYNSLSALDSAKLIFLTSEVLNGKEITEISKIIDENLFVFSIVEFGNESELECESCSGSGSIECDDCYGSGEVECGDCGGSGEVECDKCDGLGTDEEESECDNCKGSGEIQCQNCDGSGNVTCVTCDGDGNQECYRCDGTGNDRVGGADFDIEMYVSYNPVLKNLIFRKFESKEEFEYSNMESEQTLLIKRNNTSNEEENLDIDESYQNENYVNYFEDDIEEVEYELNKGRDGFLRLVDGSSVNDYFKQ